MIHLHVDAWICRDVWWWHWITWQNKSINHPKEELTRLNIMPLYNYHIHFRKQLSTKSNQSIFLYFSNIYENRTYLTNLKQNKLFFNKRKVSNYLKFRACQRALSLAWVWVAYPSPLMNHSPGSHEHGHNHDDPPLISWSKYSPLDFSGVDVLFGWMPPSVDEDDQLMYLEKNLNMVSLVRFKDS